MDLLNLLNNSNAGLEIETCVYCTDYMKEDFEMMSDQIIWKFYEHLQTCLKQKGLKIVYPHDFENYNDWMLTHDSSIQCPNNEEEVREAEGEGYIFGELVRGNKEVGVAGKYRINADEYDRLSYAPIEIVTSVYQYKHLSDLQETISSCLITDDFAYGFNSSQGIHYNISNIKLNQMKEEDKRYFAIERILELMWYLEPMFVSFLPKYRQKEVYNGTYCNSLKRVFGNLSIMKDNWRNFYTKSEDPEVEQNEHTEMYSGNGFFVPKYTIINLKNITESSTADVYFEFRLGSIHMIPELINAWIKMLMVLVVSGIDENKYSQIVPSPSDRRKRIRDPEYLFREILEEIGGPDMVEETLGVVEVLPLKGGPGLG